MNKTLDAASPSPLQDGFFWPAEWEPHRRTWMCWPARAECFGEAWNFGGAATINSMDFITRIYRAVGRGPKYRTVGAGMLKFLGWFNPTLRELVEMLYLQETPVILDDSKLRAKFQEVRKTPYDQGIALTLDWMRKG